MSAGKSAIEATSDIAVATDWRDAREALEALAVFARGFLGAAPCVKEKKGQPGDRR